MRSSTVGAASDGDACCLDGGGTLIVRFLCRLLSLIAF
jgi:hypothetical protein